MGEKCIKETKKHQNEANHIWAPAWYVIITPSSSNSDCRAPVIVPDFVFYQIRRQERNQESDTPQTSRRLGTHT